MKYYFFCFLVGLVIISAYDNPINTTNTTDDTSNIKTELTASFYKRLEGTIADKKVVLHLQKVDNNVSGTYYYNGAWLNLSTDTLIGKDSIILMEENNLFYEPAKDINKPVLSLKWTGNGFTGNWKDGKDKKNYPVYLIEKYPEGSYTFNLSSYKDSVKAYPTKTNSPLAIIAFENLNAIGNNKAATYLNQELKGMMGIPINQKDWIIGFKLQAEKYFADYCKDLKKIMLENGKDSFAYWMNYTSYTGQKIVFNRKNFIVFELYSNVYTGGAHGDYNSTMYCYDVKNQKKLTLDDVIKIDSNTLKKLLEQNLRKQYHIKAGEALNTVLFDNFLKPNKNFYFNDNGLAFLYNPSIVASHAQGQIVVFIPFTELKPYMVSAFSKRLGLK